MLSTANEYLSQELLIQTKLKMQSSVLSGFAHFDQFIYFCSEMIEKSAKTKLTFSNKSSNKHYGSI